VARPLKFSRTLNTLWSIDSQKIRKSDAAGCQILRLKCTKFDFRWGSAPYHTGELTAPQALKLYLRGATSKGREVEKGRRRRGREKGREREEERGREGRGGVRPPNILA